MSHATTASTAVKNFASKQGIIWVVPAPGTDMVFLGLKLALLLMAYPISLFILLHSQSPCFSCYFKSIYLPNAHAKLYLLPLYSPFLLLLQYTLLQQAPGLYFPASHLP